MSVPISKWIKCVKPTVIVKTGTGHFTAHCEMIFAVIGLQFAVISLQFAVIDLQFAVIDLQIAVISLQFWKLP